MIGTVSQMNDVAHCPVVSGLALLIVTHGPWVIQFKGASLLTQNPWFVMMIIVL